jgi:hypothetical protein
MFKNYLRSCDVCGSEIPKGERYVVSKITKRALLPDAPISLGLARSRALQMAMRRVSSIPPTTLEPKSRSLRLARKA